MKKVLISLSVLFILFPLLRCAGTQKSDPKITVCKEGCSATFNRCVKKASKNEAKKAACEAAKTKCDGDCEKK